MNELFGLTIMLVLFLTLGCDKKLPATGPAVAETAVAPTPEPQEVAVLEKAQGSVEVRPHQELAWNRAGEGVKLFNRDGVRTTDRSNCVIRFGDGTLLDVAPKTSIIIMERVKGPTKDSSTVAIPAGDVRGHLQKSEREMELTVRTPRAWVRTTNRDPGGAQIESQFTASIQDGRLNVVSEKGEVKIVMKGREAPLRSGETLLISAPHGGSAEATFDEPPAVTESEFKIVSSKTSTLKAPKGLSTAPPHFDLTYPLKEVTVSSDFIEVKGRMTGKMKAFVNGAEITSGPNGAFLKRVDLNHGNNLLTFQIIDGTSGQITYKSIEVTREK